MAKTLTQAEVDKLRAEKAAKFKELAGARVNAAIKSIGAIGKLANARAYVFDKEQVEKIVAALTAEVERVTSFYNNALEGKSVAKTGDFSL